METALEKAIRFILKASRELANHAAELDPDEDQDCIDFYLEHSQMLIDLSNDWSVDEPWQDNVVPLWYGNKKTNQH